MQPAAGQASDVSSRGKAAFLTWARLYDRHHRNATAR